MVHITKSAKVHGLSSPRSPSAWIGDKSWPVRHGASPHALRARKRQWSGAWERVASGNMTHQRGYELISTVSSDVQDGRCDYCRRRDGNRLLRGFS